MEQQQTVLERTNPFGNLAEQSLVGKEYRNLAPEVRETVDIGLKLILDIATQGKEIENEDVAKMGQVAVIGEVVRGMADRINDNYHRNDWRLVCTQKLIELAKETDVEKRMSMKEGVIDRSENYYKVLHEVQYQYEVKADKIPHGPVQKKVGDYLKESRVNSLKHMRAIADRFNDVVGYLGSDRGEKKE